jgi:hypothetical protein
LDQQPLIYLDLLLNRIEEKLLYSIPEKIPKRVTPKTVTRDFNDLRKVLILGGDDNA